MSGATQTRNAHYTRRLQCTPPLQSRDGKPNIGIHFIGRGEEFAVNTAEGTRQNRELFAQAIKEHNLYPMNTHFQLPNNRLITYKEISTTDGGPPWDATRYATVDYIITTGRWIIPSRRFGPLRKRRPIQTTTSPEQR